MARALVGYVGTHNEQVLAREVTRLRRRIAELDAEVAELRGTAAPAAQLDPQLDLELHRLAEQTAPALT